MIKCPHCGSTAVFRLRIDSDWGAGIGNYEPVNSKSEYTDEEWEMDADNRPDIEVYHCRRCKKIWE